jgi:glycosyl transferase family 87
VNSDATRPAGMHRLLLLMVLAFVGLTYAHNVARMFAVERNFADFGNYYFYASQLRAGVNVYAMPGDELDLLKRKAGLPVDVPGRPSYSPAFYLALTPLTFLSFWTANAVWFAINQAALLAALWLVYRIVRPDIDDRLTAGTLIGLVFIASQPLLENVGIGQVNTVILLLLAASCCAMRSRRDVLAGIALAVVLAIKPQFGLIFLLFAFRRNWLACASAAVMYTALQAAGAGAYGPGVAEGYWQSMLVHSSNTALVTPPHSLSLKAFFERTFSGGATGGVALAMYVAASIILSVVTFLRTARRRVDASAAFGSVVCLVLIVSPLTLEHHLIVAGLALAAGACRIRWPGWSGALFVLSFACINVRYSLDRFRGFDAGPLALFAFAKLFGVLLLWGLLLRLARRVSRREAVTDGGG